MKAILISIKPQWVAKILNGEKTIEIRKKFPKDFVGWVYIYCTKDKKYANLINRGGFLTGMVVARFWCDKVEEIKTDYAPRDNFFKECCLTPTELFDYIGHSKWYAIHITKLEIFDKPKELNEFVPYRLSQSNYKPFPICDFRLTNASQSWQYVEV